MQVLDGLVKRNVLQRNLDLGLHVVVVLAGLSLFHGGDSYGGLLGEALQKCSNILLALLVFDPRFDARKPALDF